MTPKNSGKPSWLQRFPFHPFLFAIYPVLALLAFNISEVELSSGFRPVIVALVVVGFLALIFQLVYQDWRRAALSLTVVLILFYSYGHIYILLKGANLDGFYLFRHRTLIPIWLGGGFLILWQVWRKPINLAAATHLLNVLGLFLLILPLFQLISYSLQSRVSQAQAAQNTQTLDLKGGNEPPDIYYIILDGYGRADVLKNEYGYDNSDFLNALRDLGFYVADCAQSNYAQTQMSLSSSLNFNYIDNLSNRFAPGSDDRTGLDALIKHGAARESLEKAGYKTVAFATGFIATEWTDADYFLSPQQTVGKLNEFEYLLMETTFARLIQDGGRLGKQNSGSELFRERTLFVLDRLDDLSYIKGPKFVFVHLVIPHPPYVFGPTGSPIEPSAAGTTKSEQEGIRYRDQAVYISNRMKEIVPKIIANSARLPVIVIQGDHGPTIPSGPQQRMRNLNVYYLPDSNAPVYSTITPVNTFRIIFNTYFGQNLPLLEDVSLYSEYDDPFRFRSIPISCQANP
jgi:hypothetical protein